MHSNDTVSDRFELALGETTPAEIAAILAFGAAIAFALMFLQEPLAHDSMHHFRHAAGIDTRITLYLGFVILGAVTATVTVLAYKRGARRHLGVGVVAYRGLAIVSQAGVWLLIATAYNGLRRRASVDDTSIGVETRGTTHQ